MKGAAAQPQRTGEPGSPASLERRSRLLTALVTGLAQAPEAVARPWPAGEEPGPGARLGRFELRRELGRGGFGVVWEALDRELDRPVAVKLVRPGARLAALGEEWALREAQAVARLNHPAIVTLHDLGQGPAGPYLVFELLRGETLADRLERGPLPLGQALELGAEVARALAHAHAAGVVHRDLTAANVHLGEDGAIKVLDFGLAHLFGHPAAGSGGTPAYMAPEQWRGEAGDARTDLFSLGVILHQALSGALPYPVEQGGSAAERPGRAPPLPRTAAPRAVRALVRALLERDPARRPQRALEVRDRLRALRGGEAGRRAWPGWAAGALALAALGAAAWGLLRRELPREQRVGVVVAALEGGTGVAARAPLEGSLGRALDRSKRIWLVPAARLEAVALQAGMGPPGRLDAARGRMLARLAGAEVLLLPELSGAGAGRALRVRAIEAETGRELLQASAPLPADAEPADLVDPLARSLRPGLEERAAPGQLRRPVAPAVTASAEAARLYYQGRDCEARPVASRGSVEQCRVHYLRALALDPTFPLAHFALARLSFLPGASGEEAAPHLRAALAGVERLPALEAGLVRGLAARLERRWADAAAVYDPLLAQMPWDAELIEAAADVSQESLDWGALARHAEQMMAVRPEEEDPVLWLVEALGRGGERERLRALVARLEPQAARRVPSLVLAYTWLGEPGAAVALARRAVEAEGEAQLENLRAALQAAGEFAEAEAIARRQLAADPAAYLARYRIDSALAAQGRVNEALRWLDQTEQRTPSAEAAALAYREAMLAAATWNPQRIWPIAARELAVMPVYASKLTVLFDLLGDPDHADLLARGLRPGSQAEAQHLALRAWRAGDRAGAVAALEQEERRDAWPNEGLAPAYLLAEVHAAGGDAGATLAAVDRFFSLPGDRVWRSWAYPRALYLAAEAHLRLGDRAAARRELDRLLALLARADPSVTLAARARRLREGL